MESATLDAYLYFTGNCREAMEFYQSVFGGKLDLVENPDGSGKVMHARLDGGLVRLLASDGTRREPYGPSMISLMVMGSDEAKLRAAFDALSQGGTVTSAMKPEMWGDIFGSLTDKYGVDWQIDVTAAS